MTHSYTVATLHAKKQADLLAHPGLEKPYDDIDLGLRWLR